MQVPNPLLELGGVPLACHALWQLNAAKYASIVVVVGHQGAEVQRAMQEYLKSESSVFEGLQLEFVDLGVGFRGGWSASIASAQPALQSMLAGNDSFVIVCTDHIFDESLLEEAAAVDLCSDGKGDAACVLVETDLAGMRGLPHTAVFCGLRQHHGSDRVYTIGSDIETYSGIEAGLFVFNLESLEKLVAASKAKSKGASVSTLSEFAARGQLRLMKTNGRTWFSVETTESAQFTSENLQSRGQTYKLADGREVNLVGLPKIEKSSDGGEWAEFSVEKWRSAVYTARSFFSELFVDTTDFVGELCDKLGGNAENGPLLVEVGCGTGEALVPLFTAANGATPRARYSCGVDFNPHFIEFCSKTVPEQDQDNVRHLVGDAQELVTLMHTELPKEWNVAGRPKVVMCVGNTIGIIPSEIRTKVYQQMKKLAGADGYMVVIYWNGNRFGDAVQNFYHKNPQLCGPFTGSGIDLDTCTLTTPSGYCTHWTTPEEARDIFENEIGVEVIKVLEKGNGVLVAGRMRP